jgi:hypothetical protein
MFSARSRDYEQKTGALAIGSILLAIGSFVLVFMGHPVMAFICAVLAVPAGFLGLVMAASSRVSGGIMSILGMLIGAGGLIFAILGIIGAILF